MTSALRADEVVEKWFERVGAADIKLPDRWFGGKPYDNLFELTWVAMRPRKLLVEFDEQVLLIFTEVPAVREETLEAAEHLVFTDFQQLVVDRQDFGASAARATRYRPPVIFGCMRRRHGR